MSDPAKLTASIQVPDAFKVGPNPGSDNLFQLVIRNLGEPVTRTGTRGGNLYLKGALGASAEALFFDDSDARKCIRKVLNPPGWKTEWDFTGKNEGRFGLRIYTFNPVLFAANAVLTIEFSPVVSRTAPGSAVLSFETDVAAGPQKLSIEKQTDQPDIISFYSIPAEGVQILPGEDVELKWRTYRLSARELTRAGRADPLPCDFSRDEGSKTIPAVAAETTFQLRGYDGGKWVDRTLTVKVLGKGWYDLKNVILEGDPGYPSARDETEAEALEAQPLEGRIELEPTLLLNANDRNLYGLFRHQFEGRERTLLFETENPFAGWRFVASAVPGEAGFSPQGFGGSPGVYFDDRIWLIGGSQIDPGHTSNGVWCLDPRQGGSWENRGEAPWRRRMGHAVLVFENRIWVMGGRDEAGNALSDVWTLDVGNGNRQWQAQAGTTWPPRCLFTPAVFDEKIWLYGGVKEPFSDALYDDLYIYAEGEWAKNDMTGILAGDNDSRKPIASSLQVFEGYLHLFGTFRTVMKKGKSEIIERLIFRLSSPTTGTWDQLDATGLKGWGADTTFSYQSANFRDQLIIARALAYDAPNPWLKVYVPSA